MKLDNDIAKAEFLGIEVEQFKALEFSKNLNEVIKLPDYAEPANLPLTSKYAKSSTNYNGGWQR